ncbi:unnamed protein product [Rotaria socialis]|uniref:Uncharacterized protein n=2 Tax=Rotaria socialis TaxID=392032 RepID=A0A820EBD2_9BILA|nr:unnamed protein product [Rotaria socialis]CAF4444135.1 unnamed protein product [Rotaria socialis]CAF4626485.1 unnamed protein product [Rotaria socialis]
MNQCSLFKCTNESRRISYHLLSDGYGDCLNDEDENEINVCSVNLSYRYKCEHGTRYIHQTLIDDGIMHYSDGSDESRAHHGRDEPGCFSNALSPIHCNQSAHFCLNIDNGFQSCLPRSKTNDGTIDCVGSTDERLFCMMKYPYDHARRYRCRNSNQCISPIQVCSCHQDCPENDDETIACIGLNNGQESFWDENTFRCRDGNIFTGLHVHSTDNPPSFFRFCPDYYYDDRCQFQRKRLTAVLSLQLTTENHESIHFTYFHRPQSGKPKFTQYLDEIEYLHNLAFIQLYEDRVQSHYYLLLLLKNSSSPLREITSEVRLSNLCRPIRELLNSTVLTQPPLRRIKNYQQPCLKPIVGEPLKCFYDDKIMYFCDQTHHSECFNFEMATFGCSSNKCHSREICVQNHDVCPTNSMCLCEPCSYGYICQFSAVGYTLSFNAIIDPHMRSINNSDSGYFCYYYYCCHSRIEQQNFSCSLIEFLLKWSSTTCERLNACVSIERAPTVIYQTHFSLSKSKHQAKCIVTGVILFTTFVYSTELIFRRTVIDKENQRTWCVLTLNSDRRILSIFYSASNIMLLVSPLVINLTSSSSIILGTLQSKQYLMGKH